MYPKTDLNTQKFSKFSEMSKEQVGRHQQVAGRDPFSKTFLLHQAEGEFRHGALSTADRQPLLIPGCGFTVSHGYPSGVLLVNSKHKYKAFKMLSETNINVVVVIKIHTFKK